MSRTAPRTRSRLSGRFRPAAPVVKFRGAAKYLHDAFRDASGSSRPSPPAVARRSSVPAVRPSAAPADEPFFGGQAIPDSPSGPYPRLPGEPGRRFTSDGPGLLPRRFPGARRAEEARLPPRLTVSTSLSADYSPFYGTSAAAPHAARIAALGPVRQPGKGAAFVRNAFQATARPFSARRLGRKALAAASCAPTHPAPHRRRRPSPSCDDRPRPWSTSDGDAYPSPRRDGTVSVAVTNSGDGPATCPRSCAAPMPASRSRPDVAPRRPAPATRLAITTVASRPGSTAPSPTRRHGHVHRPPVAKQTHRRSRSRPASAPPVLRVWAGCTDSRGRRVRRA